MFFKSCFCIQFFLTVHLVSGQTSIPNATVEVFDQGFDVSIPDRKGITLFGFHGNINEEIFGRDQGTLMQNVIEAKNGKWTFSDKTTKLSPGDTLYFWTYVEYLNGTRKMVEINDNQKFVVPGFSAISETPLSTASTLILTSPQHIFPTTPSTANCRKSITTVNGKRPCAGALIFDESFDGDLDPRKWTPEVQFAGSPDLEFVVYINNTKNLQIENGVLSITPSLLEDEFGKGAVDNELDLRERCTGEKGTMDCTRKPVSYNILPPIISGRVNTRNKFDFLYGRVEIRAQMPVGMWIYPELYLEPTARLYGPNYDSGSMRIALTIGNSGKLRDLMGGLVLGVSEKARTSYMKFYSGSNPWSEAMHTYSLEWRPDRINLLVDDILYGEIKPPSQGFTNLQSSIQQPAAALWETGTILAPFDKEFHLVLGVGAGGLLFPDNVDGKPWQNKDPKLRVNFLKNKDLWFHSWHDKESSLRVDSVRVYAL